MNKELEELVKLATKAVTERKLKCYFLNNNGDISLTKNDGRAITWNKTVYTDTKDYLKTLYTEKFTINEFQDTKKLKSGAKAILTNGEVVIFSNRSGVDDSLWFEYSNFHSTIIPFIALKGAHVTQLKGD